MRHKLLLFAFLVALLLLLSGCAESFGDAIFRIASKNYCVDSSKGSCEGDSLRQKGSRPTATGCEQFDTLTPCEFGCFGMKGKSRCRTAEEAAGIQQVSYQCSDRIDNDADTLIDISDPGCSSASDNDESNAPLPACSDRLDNDADGKIDTADPGCASTSDNDEINTVDIDTAVTPVEINCVDTYGAGAKCISRDMVRIEQESCTASGGTLATHCSPTDNFCTVPPIITAAPALATPVVFVPVTTAPVVVSRPSAIPVTGKAISPVVSPGVASSTAVSPAVATSPALKTTPIVPVTEPIAVPPGTLDSGTGCCVKCVNTPILAPGASVAPTPVVTAPIVTSPVITGPVVSPAVTPVITTPPARIIPSVGRASLNTGLVDCSSFGKEYFCVATETEFQYSCKGKGEMYPTASCLTESEAKGFCVIC